MPITIHPERGQILFCDFSTGFKVPEMVKSKRPVIILSPRLRRRPDLVTVVALSTQAPEEAGDYHLKLPSSSLPQLGMFATDSWVKGDMVYTVGFHRLNLIRLGTRDPQTGKRRYFKDRLSRDRMREVYSCVLHGLGIGHLTPHL